jgi:hypothetical protein
MSASDPTRLRVPTARPRHAPSRAEQPRTVLGAVGLGLVILWGAWWVASVRQGRMVGGGLTWVPALPFLAGDFAVHLDHVGRVWAAGGDPYRGDDWSCAQNLYPPLTSCLFGWTSLLSPPAALDAWLIALALLTGAGAWAAWRVRRDLGLRDVPPTIALAAVLYSTPALMAMERGQCDMLILPCLLGAAWLLQTGSRAAEIVAGSLLAVAAWVKYYPGLLGLGLLALRRRRALAGFVAAGAAIGLADVRGVRRSLENCRQAAATIDALRAGYFAWEHSIAAGWRAFWAGSRWWPAKVPGPLAAVALLSPALIGVSLRIARSPRRDRLAYPYFLWLVAAATFVPVLSNDYNLVSLPMVALAVWDRRDPAIVHALLVLLLVWWQPLRLPIDATLLLSFKFAGLVAVGLSLAERAREPHAEVAPRPAAIPAHHMAPGPNPTR